MAGVGGADFFYGAAEAPPPPHHQKVSPPRDGSLLAVNADSNLSWYTLHTARTLPSTMNDTQATPPAPDAPAVAIDDVLKEYVVLIVMHAVASALVWSTRLPILVRVASLALPVTAAVCAVHGTIPLPIGVSDTILRVEFWLGRCDWLVLACASMIAAGDRAHRILGAVSRGVAATVSSAGGAAVVNEIGTMIGTNHGTVTINQTTTRRRHVRDEAYDMAEMMRET